MADIELAIKIPDTTYEGILNADKAGGSWGNDLLGVLCAGIANGTPLSKGHGRLIDEKEINTVVNGVFNVFDKHSSKTFLNIIHNQCIEAVGVDKAEREDKE